MGLYYNMIFKQSFIHLWSL